MSEEGAAKTSLFEGVPFKNVLKCVHCGLCLDACPTYRALGTEQDSPRGRLYLMRGLWQGELSLSREMVQPLSRCLDCRACETACPSGVPYGELLEKTRGAIRTHQKPSLGERLLRGFFLGKVLASTRLMKVFSRAGRLYQRMGFPRLVTGPFARWLPSRLVHAHGLMPRFSGFSFKTRHAGHRYPPPAGQALKKRVALFTGCIMDVAEDEIHRASLALLRAAECEVVMPASQTCCGALHVHAGEREMARDLARRNRAALGRESLDGVIVNAAGCGAQLKEYHHLFSDSKTPNQAGWESFGRKVKDLIVFLAEMRGFLESLTWDGVRETVFYDAPCHLLHAQKKDVSRFLGQIPGVTLLPLREAAFCCGAAGIYNLAHPELAETILDRKLADIENLWKRHPGTKTLITGNPGCLFQLRAGVRKRHLPLEIIHPAVFLARKAGL